MPGQGAQAGAITTAVAHPAKRPKAGAWLVTLPQHDRCRLVRVHAWRVPVQVHMHETDGSGACSCIR